MLEVGTNWEPPEEKTLYKSATVVSTKHITQARMIEILTEHMQRLQELHGRREHNGRA